VLTLLQLNSRDKGKRLRRVSRGPPSHRRALARWRERSFWVSAPVEKLPDRRAEHGHGARSFRKRSTISSSVLSGASLPRMNSHGHRAPSRWACPVWQGAYARARIRPGACDCNAARKPEPPLRVDVPLRSLRLPAHANPCCMACPFYPPYSAGRRETMFALFGDPARAPERYGSVRGLLWTKVSA